MAVAKVIELSCTSPTSFEDALQQGIARAHRTLSGVVSAWIKEQRVEIADGQVKNYQINLLVTFILKDE